MLDEYTRRLIDLLGGPDDPEARSLLWAAAHAPEMAADVPGLVRGLCRKRGIDPDNPPTFGLPRGLSPSDYAIGRAKCGAVLGEEVGLSQRDLPGHIAIVGSSGVGKTTLVKLLLLAFSGKGR